MKLLVTAMVLSMMLSQLSCGDYQQEGVVEENTVSTAVQYTQSQPEMFTDYTICGSYTSTLTTIDDCWQYSPQFLHDYCVASGTPCTIGRCNRLATCDTTYQSVLWAACAYQYTLTCYCFCLE
jgi:hypothetical protein